MLRAYKQQAINKTTSNICSFFLDKAVSLSTHVALVFPKFILNTPEFSKSRDYLSKKCVNGIIDFGENGFPGVLIETIALFIDNSKKPSTTHVRSTTERIDLRQSQKYIFDEKLPYWIIYRNELFDSVFSKMTFDVFSVFRDRQITNKNLFSEDGENRIRVIKSRNISDDGTTILDINGYDAYIDIDVARNCSVYKYIDEQSVYITPNMTYYPRVMEKPANTLVNGSVAILIPKTLFMPSKRQLLYFSSDEFRKFYRIARNYQTRSLNIDACSVFFFGLVE